MAGKANKSFYKIQQANLAHWILHFDFFKFPAKVDLFAFFFFSKIFFLIEVFVIRDKLLRPNYFLYLERSLAHFGNVEEFGIGDVGSEEIVLEGSPLEVAVVSVLAGENCRDGGRRRVGPSGNAEGTGKINGDTLDEESGIPPVEVLATVGVVSDVGGVLEPVPVGREVSSEGAVVADGPVQAIERVVLAKVKAGQFEDKEVGLYIKDFSMKNCSVSVVVTGFITWTVEYVGVVAELEVDPRRVGFGDHRTRGDGGEGEGNKGKDEESNLHLWLLFLRNKTQRKKE